MHLVAKPPNVPLHGCAPPVRVMCQRLLGIGRFHASAIMFDTNLTQMPASLRLKHVVALSAVKEGSAPGTAALATGRG